MMDLFSEDIELIKELIHYRRLDIFLLHEKYRLSPAQVARSLRKFYEDDLIKITGTDIAFTEKGLLWIQENRINLFLNKRNQYWKDIPKEMRTKKEMKRGILYIPLKKNDDNY